MLTLSYCFVLFCFFNIKEFRGRELRIQFAKQRRPDDPKAYYSRRDRHDR